MSITTQEFEYRLLAACYMSQRDGSPWSTTMANLCNELECPGEWGVVADSFRLLLDDQLLGIRKYQRPDPSGQYMWFDYPANTPDLEPWLFRGQFEIRPTARARRRYEELVLARQTDGQLRPRLNLKRGSRFGKWTLDRHLNSGAGGIVWRARSATGEDGAIKFLRSSLYRRTSYKRFAREIRALKELKGLPGILPLLDSHLPNEPSIEDPAWLVTVYAVPLKEALGPDSSPRSIVKRVRELATGLYHMHAKDIPHRDIKPENCFVYEDHACIGDFGLADFPDATSLTEHGKKMGPQFYIAPEMLQDADTADGKPADVYSLAKMLWVLGTGQLYPFPGHHHLGEPAMLISTYVADAGFEVLNPIVEAATRHDPKKRPTAEEFGKELDAYLNPSNPVRSTADLSDLRGKVLAAVGPGQQKFEQVRDIQKSCQALLNSIEPHVRRVEEALATAGIQASTRTWGKQGSTNSTILGALTESIRLPEDKRVFSSGDATVFNAHGTEALMWLAAGVEATSEGMAVLIVGFVFRDKSGRSQQLGWHGRREFLLGGPREGTSVVELSDGLLQNARSAVEQFLRIIKGE